MDPWESSSARRCDCGVDGVGGVAGAEKKAIFEKDPDSLSRLDSTPSLGVNRASTRWGVEEEGGRSAHNNALVTGVFLRLVVGVVGVVGRVVGAASVVVVVVVVVDVMSLRFLRLEGRVGEEGEATGVNTLRPPAFRPPPRLPPRLPPLVRDAPVSGRGGK